MAASPKIIQVSWIDAVADVGWESKTKAEIHHCITVGYLIDETRNYCAKKTCKAKSNTMESQNAAFVFAMFTSLYIYIYIKRAYIFIQYALHNLPHM